MGAKQAKPKKPGISCSQDATKDDVIKKMTKGGKMCKELAATKKLQADVEYWNSINFELNYMKVNNYTRFDLIIYQWYCTVNVARFKFFFRFDRPCFEISDLLVHLNKRRLMLSGYTCDVDILTCKSTNKT